MTTYLSQEAGNLNVAQTVTAAQFVGGGAGLTNVSASFPGVPQPGANGQYIHNDAVTGLLVADGNLILNANTQLVFSAPIIAHQPIYMDAAMQTVLFSGQQTTTVGASAAPIQPFPIANSSCSNLYFDVSAKDLTVATDSAIYSGYCKASCDAGGVVTLSAISPISSIVDPALALASVTMVVSGPNACALTVNGVITDTVNWSCLCRQVISL